LLGRHDWRAFVEFLREFFTDFCTDFVDKTRARESARHGTKTVGVDCACFHRNDNLGSIAIACGLCQQLVHYFSSDVGETEIAALKTEG
jgi:hypothetical protein